MEILHNLVYIFSLFLRFHWCAICGPSYFQLEFLKRNASAVEERLKQRETLNFKKLDLYSASKSCILLFR